MSEALRLIMKYEGLGDGDKSKPGLQPYLCPARVWTIGYGSTRGLDGKRLTKVSPGITEFQAQHLLARDSGIARRAVLRNVTVPLDDWQIDALTSFTFNLGAGALKSSTLLRRVNSFEWEDVDEQFLRWVYAGGRKLSGLVRRRYEEADVWIKGMERYDNPA